MAMVEEERPLPSSLSLSLGVIARPSLFFFASEDELSFPEESYFSSQLDDVPFLPLRAHAKDENDRVSSEGRVAERRRGKCNSPRPLIKPVSPSASLANKDKVKEKITRKYGVELVKQEEGQGDQ